METCPHWFIASKTDCLCNWDHWQHVPLCIVLSLQCLFPFIVFHNITPKIPVQLTRYEQFIIVLSFSLFPTDLLKLISRESSATLNIHSCTEPYACIICIIHTRYMFIGHQPSCISFLHQLVPSAAFISWVSWFLHYQTNSLHQPSTPALLRFHLIN